MKQQLKLTVTIPGNYLLEVDKVYESEDRHIIAIFKTERVAGKNNSAPREVSAEVTVDVLGGPLEVNYIVISDLSLKSKKFTCLQSMDKIYFGSGTPICLYDPTEDSDRPIRKKTRNELLMEELFIGYEKLIAENEALKKEVEQLRDMVSTKASESYNPKLF